MSVIFVLFKNQDICMSCSGLITISQKGPGQVWSLPHYKGPGQVWSLSHYKGPGQVGSLSHY